VPSADPSLTADAERGRWHPPRWAAPVSMLLSAAGSAVAAYLTLAHYNSGTQLSCPNTGAINCAKVTTSEQSALLGVPVAVLGLLFFLGMLVLSSPPLWRQPARPIRLLRLAAAGTGVLMVLWLIFAELFLINAICLWCSGVHGIALLLFVTVALATASGTSHAALSDAELDEGFDDDGLVDGLPDEPDVPDTVPTGGAQER